jgi:hypothetical protein
MDDFIDRTLTDLQLFCHFINSHPSVVESQWTYLFIVPFSHHCRWVPWLFFISYICLATWTLFHLYTLCYKRYCH